jgi:dinuclear metal center YbgI/SA1388 family protein
MPSTSLDQIVTDADTFLKIDTIADSPNAFNGLQLANKGTIHKIGAAVDASEAVFRDAAAAKVDLLLVHHGMLWTDIRPITGATYRKLRFAIEHNLAVYSAHLPLDAHPAIGNNALLAKALGWSRPKPFFEEEGCKIGLRISTSITRDELAKKLSKIVGGEVKICPGGPFRSKQIGLVSGGAGNSVAQAAAEGVDTFITGEGAHHTYGLAEELGVNILYAGHYATETFGIKALAYRLAKKFKLPWEFIDHPTGL